MQAHAESMEPLILGFVFELIQHLKPLFVDEL